MGVKEWGGEGCRGGDKGKERKGSEMRVRWVGMGDGMWEGKVVKGKGEGGGVGGSGKGEWGGRVGRGSGEGEGGGGRGRR